MNAVVSTITELLPAEIIDTDPEQIRLYSQDVFTVGPPICAVVRPRNIDEVQSLVRACLERSTPIVTRGGGMSYTSGYLATAPQYSHRYGQHERHCRDQSRRPLRNCRSRL